MSTERGRRAEDIAASYLQGLGHRIQDRNWRTRWCEIDIVTVRKETVYFVEVKYRQSNAFGSGLEYITPKKLAQMRFAAEFWMASNSYGAQGYRLAAVEVTGEGYKVTSWLDDLL